MPWYAVGFWPSVQDSFKLDWTEEKSVMAVWTVLHEIKRNINIDTLSYFVQETTIRTELGFTVAILISSCDRC